MKWQVLGVETRFSVFVLAVAVSARHEAYVNASHFRLAGQGQKRCRRVPRDHCHWLAHRQETFDFNRIVGDAVRAETLSDEAHLRILLNTRSS